ncbi:hypothetical protein BBP00_00007510, partial [Phytophthora kernoviae]
RVDRNKVVLGRVISNGGCGQVLSGRFNGKRVAVKMLLPDNRKSVKHLNAFLEEVKLMARLDHPRIVKFIGVAWDSLSDLCVLTKFMEGGDLRRLLDNYEAQNFPVGFNETKVTIALHVAHALTYLHSLDPPVLHRDLKSRNILLNANLDARLADFGISREHEDDTMTAGVGTSRWMAPEVMMGERYDEKADMFSLGVVLSELDLHCLPYSHAVEDNNPSRKLPNPKFCMNSDLESKRRRGKTSALDTVASDRVSADGWTRCTSHGFGGYSIFVSETCNITDRFMYSAEMFKGFDYVIMEEYLDIGCNNLIRTSVYPASGTCEKTSVDGSTSDIVSLYANGTAVVLLFDNGDCGSEPSLGFVLDSDEVSSGHCIQGRHKFYSNSPVSSSGSTGKVSAYESASGIGIVTSTSTPSITGGTIVGIVAGVVAVVALLGFAALRWRNRRRGDMSYKDSGIPVLASSYAGYPTPASALDSITLASESSYSQEDTTEPRTLTNLWEDEIIITARVPREKVYLGELISRGAYGEVYAGFFNDERVAIKILLPEMRKSVKHVNAFLTEVKMMATLNHERIVQFIGVAWDSLIDLCVLSEYMEGGDLRSLLTTYEELNFPVGFDRSKARIALHVAHALTYLHSLSTPVLHRDLKSKNILLTGTLDAKLTDFGVSRERADFTMTGGIGTSRWMAPEVMMGERYDDKADIFSFGIVLSELDQHVLPYANAKENMESSRSMPGTAILQLVAMGKLQIEFSPAVPESIVALGMACVAVDPNDRPTAAGALYKLHTILEREL